MTAIFVDPEFAELVDGYCAVHIPFIRLGARIVDNGPHAGKGFVPTDIITCSPEWTQLFSAFVVGQPTLEPGTDISFADPSGKVWTYAVKEVKDPSTLFKKQTV